MKWLIKELKKYLNHIYFNYPKINSDQKCKSWGFGVLEFWINGKLSKIGRHFSNKVILKLMLSIKNVNKEMCS